MNRLSYAVPVGIFGTAVFRCSRQVSDLVTHPCKVTGTLCHQQKIPFSHFECTSLSLVSVSLCYVRLAQVPWNTTLLYQWVNSFGSCRKGNCFSLRPANHDGQKKAIGSSKHIKTSHIMKIIKDSELRARALTHTHTHTHTHCRWHALCDKLAPILTEKCLENQTQRFRRQ